MIISNRLSYGLPLILRKLDPLAQLKLRVKSSLTSLTILRCNDRRYQSARTLRNIVFRFKII